MLEDRPVAMPKSKLAATREEKIQLRLPKVISYLLHFDLKQKLTRCLRDCSDRFLSFTASRASQRQRQLNWGDPQTETESHAFFPTYKNAPDQPGLQHMAREGHQSCHICNMVAMLSDGGEYEPKKQAAYSRIPNTKPSTSVKTYHSHVSRLAAGVESAAVLRVLVKFCV